MTKFLDKSFSVQMGGDQQYRDNWEATFGNKAAEMPSEAKPPCVSCGATDTNRRPMHASPYSTMVCDDTTSCAERKALRSSSKEQRPEPNKEPEPYACDCDSPPPGHRWDCSILDRELRR